MFHELTGAEADATGRLDIGVPLMNMDGSASLRPTTLHTTPLITREEATRHRNRRTVKEYRVWGEGLRGSLRLFISLTGTVWAPIFPQILLILLCTGGVTLFHTYVMAFTYPMTGHQIVLVPMSFLLVFRCSNSYQRYWDGRSLLGSLVYSCRELVSKGYLYPTIMHVEASWGSSDPTRSKRTQRVVDRFSDDCKRYVMCVAMLINATVGRYWDVIEEQRRTRKTTKNAGGAGEPGGSAAAAASALAEAASGQGQPRFDIACVRPHLTDEEYADLSECDGNHPVLLLTWLRAEIQEAERRGYLTPLNALDMNQTLGELQQVWNGMLKITSTPLPFPWVHLSRVVLFLFLITLIPPAVVVMEWSAAGFMFGVSFLFLGLVQIGTEMEDPFGTDINDFDLVAFEGIIKRDLDLMARTHTTRRRRQQSDRDERAKQGKEDNSDAAALFWRGGGVAAAAAAAGGGSFALGHADAAAAAAAVAAAGGAAPAPPHQLQRRRSVTPTSVPSSASPGAGGGGGRGFGGPQEKERPLTSQRPGSYRASVDMGGSYVRCTELQRMRSTTALDDCTHAVL